MKRSKLKPMLKKLRENKDIARTVFAIALTLLMIYLLLTIPWPAELPDCAGPPYTNLTCSYGGCANSTMTNSSKLLVLRFRSYAYIDIDGRRVVVDDPITPDGAVYFAGFFGHPSNAPAPGGSAEFYVCLAGVQEQPTANGVERVTIEYCGYQPASVSYNSTAIVWSGSISVPFNVTVYAVTLKAGCNGLCPDIMFAPLSRTLTAGDTVDVTFVLELPEGINTLPFAQLVATVQPNASRAVVSVCGERVMPLMYIDSNYGVKLYETGEWFTSEFNIMEHNVTVMELIIPSTSFTRTCVIEARYEGYTLLYRYVPPGSAIILSFGGGYSGVYAGGHVRVVWEWQPVSQTYVMGGVYADWQVNLLKFLAFVFTGDKRYLANMTCYKVESHASNVVTYVDMPLGAILLDNITNVELVVDEAKPIIYGFSYGEPSTGIVVSPPLQYVYFYPIDGIIVGVSFEAPSSMGYPMVSLVGVNYTINMNSGSFSYELCPILAYNERFAVGNYGINPAYMAFEVFGANATGLAELLDYMLYPTPPQPYNLEPGGYSQTPLILYPAFVAQRQAYYTVEPVVLADSSTPVETSVYMNITEGLLVVVYKFNATRAEAFKLIAQYNGHVVTILERDLGGRTGLFVIRVWVRLVPVQ